MIWSLFIFPFSSWVTFPFPQSTLWYSLTSLSFPTRTLSPPRLMIVLQVVHSSWNALSVPTICTAISFLCKSLWFLWPPYLKLVNSVSLLFRCLYISFLEIAIKCNYFLSTYLYMERNFANIAHHFISSVSFSVWHVVSVQVIFFKRIMTKT